MEEPLLEGVRSRVNLVDASLLLASAGIGTGFLPLPAAAKAAGVWPTVAAIIFSATVTFLSTAVLLHGTSATGCDTYGLVVEKCTAWRLRITNYLTIIDLLMCIYLLLSQISFLIFIADFCGVGESHPYRGTLITTASMLIGLLAEREVAGITYLARLSTLAILGTAVAIVLLTASSGGLPPAEQVLSSGWPHATPLPSSATRVEGLAFFAFAIAFNVPPIGADMPALSRRDAAIASGCATLTMATFYSVVIACVCVTFQQAPSIAPCFLDSYDHRNPIIRMCRVALLVTLGASATLNFLAVLVPLWGLLVPQAQRRGSPARVSLSLVLTGVCAAGAIVDRDVSELLNVLGFGFGIPETFVAPVCILVHARNNARMREPEGGLLRLT